MDKIICVGKNYLKHALELGDQVPESPLYFIKPPSSSLQIESGALETKVELPKGRGEVHHELELVLRLAEREGEFYFSHYTFGLDLTLRDLQSQLKKAGQPWEKAKVFENSAILGPWQPLNQVQEILDLTFQLKINGQLRQEGRGKDMRWQPSQLLADVATWFPLRAGDLLFTGTPHGVGPLLPADRAEIIGGPVHSSLRF